MRNLRARDDSKSCYIYIGIGTIITSRAHAFPSIDYTIRTHVQYMIYIIIDEFSENTSYY